MTPELKINVLFHFCLQSDEASVISGSIGLLASSSIGNHNALFEPIHGTYHQATGKDIANPLASILSASMLLGLNCQ